MAPVDHRQAAVIDAERNWMMGLEAMRAQDNQRARMWMRSALERDPRQFDVWLALHAMDPGNDKYLDRLMATRATAHMLRSRNHTSCSSTYRISEYAQLPLTTGIDAAYAQSARWLREGDFDRAAAVLGLVPADSQRSPQATLLRARIAIARGHDFAAVELLQQVPAEGTLAGERARLLGTALHRQEQMMAAMHTLLAAVNLQTAPGAKHEVLYELAIVHSELGNEPAAQHFLQIIYAENAAYKDVRERLFPERETEWRWQEIVSQLGEAGDPPAEPGDTPA